jgi:hypothetical protein
LFEQRTKKIFFVFVLKKKWCAKIVRKVTRKEGACSLLCLFVWVVTVAVAVLVAGSDDEPF